MQHTVYFRAFKKSVQIMACALLLSQLSGCSMPVCCGPPPASDPLEQLNRADRIDSPVMATLLQQADERIGQKQWSQAASILERALRINSRQGEAWSRLALVSLQQGRFKQAIERARRSSSYAGDNTALLGANWQLMAQAYEQLGQGEKAQQARQKSQQYRESWF